MSPGSRDRSADSGVNSETKQQNLRLRAKMMRAVRRFFDDRGYMEVETPHILSAPIPEPHISYIETPRGVLHPSPELYMKQLLASGYERIYQISRCFRAGERGDRHLPEFTLLEWYCTGTDYRGLIEGCEAMIRSVAGELGFGSTIPFRGREIGLDSPWDRVTVREAFGRYASVSLDAALASGRFEEILVGEIEPHLGHPRPMFLHDYPASMASLSRLRADDDSVCERVELYIAGLEIANGFSELNDPKEQRRRFERDLAARERSGEPTFPLPEAFLRALSRMPEAAGIALGLDRLAMVLTDQGRIDDVVAFVPES